MKQKTTQSSYESPLVRVRALSLERGFATSYGDPGGAGANGFYRNEEESENF